MKKSQTDVENDYKQKIEDIQQSNTSSTDILKQQILKLNEDKAAHAMEFNISRILHESENHPPFEQENKDLKKKLKEKINITIPELEKELQSVISELKVHKDKKPTYGQIMRSYNALQEENRKLLIENSELENRETTASYVSHDETFSMVSDTDEEDDDRYIEEDEKYSNMNISNNTSASVGAVKDEDGGQPFSLYDEHEQNINNLLNNKSIAHKKMGDLIVDDETTESELDILSSSKADFGENSNQEKWNIYEWYNNNYSLVLCLYLFVK